MQKDNLQIDSILGRKHVKDTTTDEKANQNRNDEIFCARSNKAKVAMALQSVQIFETWILFSNVPVSKAPFKYIKNYNVVIII